MELKENKDEQQLVTVKNRAEECERAHDVIFHGLFAHMHELADVVVCKSLFAAQSERSLLLWRKISDAFLQRILQIFQCH